MKVTNLQPSDALRLIEWMLRLVVASLNVLAVMVAWKAALFLFDDATPPMPNFASALFLIGAALQIRSSAKDFARRRTALLADRRRRTALLADRVEDAAPVADQPPTNLWTPRS